MKCNFFFYVVKQDLGISSPAGSHLREEMADLWNRLVGVEASTFKGAF